MDSPWGFSGMGEECDDGDYALATQELQSKEASTLKRQLSEFDSAVFGEIRLQQKPARVPSKEKFGKERHQRIPSDRQSTRPLRVQVAEWNSAFLHLRVRGEPCTVLSTESGWQWHEPREKTEEELAKQPAADTKPTPPKPRWLPGKASAGLRVASQAAHMRAAAMNGVKERRGTVKDVKSAEEVMPPEAQKGDARQVRQRLPTEPAHRGGSTTPRSTVAGPSLPEPPDLRLDGSKAAMLPASELGAAEAEEVIAQHGEFEEIFAQHTDNWAQCKPDLSVSVRQVTNRQRVRKGKRERVRNASEREQERQAAREAEAGMPPREPVACAKHEAKAILFDSLWASICPVLAPLLASLYREPAEEEEEVEDDTDSAQHGVPLGGPEPLAGLAVSPRVLSTPVHMSSTMLRALMGDESPASHSPGPGSLSSSPSPRRRSYDSHHYRPEPSGLNDAAGHRSMPNTEHGSLPGSRIGSPSYYGQRSPLVGTSPVHPTSHSLLGSQQRLGMSSPTLSAAAGSPSPGGGSRPRTPPIIGGGGARSGSPGSGSPSLPAILRSSSRSAGSAGDLRNLAISPGRVHQGVCLPVIHP